MTRLLTRLGRFTCTLVVITTVVCVVALRDDHSFSHAFAVVLVADVGAVGLAMVLADRPWRRRGRGVA